MVGRVFAAQSYVDDVNISAIGRVKRIFTMSTWGGMANDRGTDPRQHRPRKISTKAAPRAYHHGALKEALLRAAEDILVEDGVSGLTLRETARRAGVSHAAPKNHFGDLRGLMSELAAVGFQRLAAIMSNAVADADGAEAAMDAIGRAYVNFARSSPGLFHLMYRSEALDFTRAALIEATSGISSVLKDAVIRRKPARSTGKGDPRDTVASMATSWCLVHGFATLLIDQRLTPMLAYMPGDDKVGALLDAVLAKMKPSRRT